MAKKNKRRGQPALRIAERIWNGFSGLTERVMENPFRIFINHIEYLLKWNGWNGFFRVHHT